MPQTRNKDYSVELSSLATDTLNRKSNWFIEKGSLYLLLILILILFISYFIKYPNILLSEAIINSTSYPVIITAKVNGKPVEVLVNNEDYVSMGDTLIVMDSDVDHEQAKKAYELVNALIIKNSPLDSLESVMNSEYYGYFEGGIALLRGFFKELNDLEDKKYFQSRIDYLEAEKVRKRDLISVLRDQDSLKNQEYKLSLQKFQKDSLLYFQSVISEVDYIKFKSEKLLRYRSLLQNEVLIKNTESDLATIENDLREIRTQQSRSLKQIRLQINNQVKIILADIERWRRNYIITAPLEGLIANAQIDLKYSNVTTNTKLLTIIPDKNESFAVARVPIYGSGELAYNQLVYLSLYDYPSEKYGEVIGRINNISVLPRDSTYEVQINLVEPITTSFGYPIEIKPLMQARAQIVTKDMRLIERLLSSTRKSFKL